jgi:hypothetical protein
MPKQATKPVAHNVTYAQLYAAAGLTMIEYAKVMACSADTSYARNTWGSIKHDTYTELALLHADAHPFFKLVRREAGEI